MNLNVDKGLESLADKALNTMARFNPMGLESMRHDTVNLSIGGVDIDAAATMTPLYVGDSNIGKIHGLTPTMDALYKQGKVGMQYLPGKNGKWDIHFAQGADRKMIGDGLPSVMRGLTMDASGPLIAGSLLSPNSISWITELFKQPLSWSRASELVKIQTGTDPWAVVQAMAAVSPSGWGMVNSAGGFGNTMSGDVEARLGMLEQQIINIDVTYKLTIEELKRAESSGQSFPLAGQVIAYKQEYAKWISDIIRDGLIYYGNTATGNAGLLNIDTITAWTGVGSNQALATIAADGANTTKGSKIYQQFATAVVAFLNPMKNRCKKVRATMSVEAFNIFTSTVYSDAYNPANPWQIVENTFGAGSNQVLTGSIGGVKVEVACDPMLSGSGYGNSFNSQTYDYLVLTADELTAGPSDESQSLIHYGQPLGEFVYPVMPQQFSTQYRYLKRVSGVFAPYKNAVKVYSGYGYAS